MTAHDYTHENTRPTPGAHVGDHMMYRSCTKNMDEVLTIRDSGKEKGKLVVYSIEFSQIENSHYWCTCGEKFDYSEAAEEHLLEVRG